MAKLEINAETLAAYIMPGCRAKIRSITWDAARNSLILDLAGVDVPQVDKVVVVTNGLRAFTGRARLEQAP